MTKDDVNEELGLRASIYSMVVMHDMGFVALRDSNHRKWIKIDFDDWDNQAIELFSLAEEGVAPWNFQDGYDSLSHLIEHMLMVYGKGHS